MLRAWKMDNCVSSGVKALITSYLLCFVALRVDLLAGGTRGGQTFPKSTEIRNSVAFRAFFSGFFLPCFSMVAESVSEQLLQRTGGLGGQFWLSKESVSTSATDYRIPTPICTKYRLEKVRTCKIDGLYRLEMATEFLNAVRVRPWFF